MLLLLARALQLPGDGVDRRHQDRRQRLEDPLGALRIERRRCRQKLAADIAELTAKAEAADREDDDPQALPPEIARREPLKAKLMPPARGSRRKPKLRPSAERPSYEEKKAAYDGKTGRRGRPPEPANETPPPDRQTNLTDPDSVGEVGEVRQHAPEVLEQAIDHVAPP